MSEQNEKKLPEYTLMLIDADGNHVSIPISELAGILGLKTPIAARLSIKRDSLELFSEMSITERDYPGIAVDAMVRDNRTMFLGNFELPCETYPTRIAARLYAGDPCYETDSPIAIVTHETTDDARAIYRSQHYGREGMRKLVYIDHDLADSRTWKEAGEDHMPEHREDE